MADIVVEKVVEKKAKKVEKKEKITKEKLVDDVGFTPKACQSFLKRFPNYAVFVEDGF